MRAVTNPNDALRALEPATHDANAFKARSALIAMRAVVANAAKDGGDVKSGATSAWPHVAAAASSAKEAVRRDAVATLEAFIVADCVSVRDAVQRFEPAWTMVNWRARVSALETLSTTAGYANEDDARAVFRRCAAAMGDRESSVRDAAFACASAAHGAFREAIEEEFELVRNDMRPQHVKELERRLATTTTTTTTTTSAAVRNDESVPMRAMPSAVVADGLVPPPPERISNEHELKRAMNAAARDLHPDEDWLKRIAAMVRLEAIALGGGGVAFEDAFTTALGKAKEAITAQVMDRRSAVVKQASHLIVALARHATACFEPYAEHFIMALLKTTVITVGVIAESGDVGIRGIIAHCQSPKVVQRLCAAAQAERAPKMRAALIDYVGLILKTWELNKKHLDCISDALQATLSDADATVRNNSKTCFEILSATSPAASRDLLARVDSKLSGSLQDMLSIDSGSEETSERRDGRAQRVDDTSSRDRSRSVSRAGRRLGGASRVAHALVDAPPPATTVTAPALASFTAPAPPRPARDVFTAIEFAEQIERAGNRAGRVEASARLRDALDQADTRARGAEAARFEAQATKRVGRIAKLLVAYITDVNELVLDAALESISTLVYVARDELRTALPSLCLGAFERLTDAREVTRSLAAEALAAIGDLYEPNALAHALLHALKGASTARTKTGVLEFALYVFSGRGGGSDDVVYTPVSATSTLDAWVDIVVDMVGDIDETMSKAAAANLAAIHSHADDAILPRRLQTREYSNRVKFIDAIERRAPKFADILRSCVDLEKPASPPRVEPKVMRTPAAPHTVALTTMPPTTSFESAGEEDDFEDQNVSTLNRSYQSMYVEASVSKSPMRVSVESPNVVEFGQRIVRALENMRDDDESIVVKGLTAIARAAKSDSEQFKTYLALVAPRMCAAMGDSRSIVAAHAMYAMRSVFERRDVGVNASEACTALAPLLNSTGTSLIAPLNCVRMIVSRSSRNGLDLALPLVVSAIVAACESDHAEVRQLAVRVLSACQSTLGAAWMAPHIEALTPLRQSMITHFAAEA